MTYNPNIPQAADLISVSQPQLLTNFQQLNTVYGTDHYPYNDATPQATMHRRVTLPIQAVAPPTIVGDAAIYTKPGVGAMTTPYARVDGGAVDYPIMSVRAMGMATTAAGGAGFNMTWGPMVAQRIPFTFAAPMPNNDYLIMATARSAVYGAESFCTVSDAVGSSPTVAGFSIYCGLQVSWIYVVVMYY